MAGPHAGNRNRPAYSGQLRFRFPKPVIQLFAPRKPIPFKPPPRKSKLRAMTGLAAFVSHFENTSTNPPHSTTKPERASHDKPPQPFETPAQRRRRIREEKLANASLIIAKAQEEWNPSEKGKHYTTDPFRTLFVSNLAYETLESRLHDEFETFGPVTELIMPKDRDGVPRGYAFVQFEREKDLKVAYRQANGMRIDGRRLLVDVERGRTVKDWLPNRLDGPNNSCARRVRRGRKAELSAPS